MHRMRMIGVLIVVLVVAFGVLNQAVLSGVLVLRYPSGDASEAIAVSPIAAEVARTLGIAPPPPTATPLGPVCDPNKPTFMYGFADLKTRLGTKMGEPLECEQAIHVGGDTRQKTTTGYAYYRPPVNIPAFASGDDHWALTDEGLVYWKGDVVDPPGVARPVLPPRR